MFQKAVNWIFSFFFITTMCIQILHVFQLITNSFVFVKLLYWNEDSKFLNKIFSKRALSTFFPSDGWLSNFQKDT